MLLVQKTDITLLTIQYKLLGLMKGRSSLFYFVRYFIDITMTHQMQPIIYNDNALSFRGQLMINPNVRLSP